MKSCARGIPTESFKAGVLIESELRDIEDLT